MKDQKEENYMLEGMSIGMCLGSGAGISIGLLFHELGIGICFGTSIGMCLGLMIGSAIKRNNEDKKN